MVPPPTPTGAPPSDGAPGPPPPGADAPAGRGAAPAGPTAAPRPSPLRTILLAPVAGATWRSYLYLLAAAPLSLAAFCALAVSAWLGLLLAITVIGIPMLSLIVLGAREYGAVPRALARTVLGEQVEAPRRRRPRSTGFFPWLRASLGDLDGWRAIAFVVVSFPVTVVGAWLVAVILGVGITMFTYPVFWQVVDPTQTDTEGVVRHSGMQFGDVYIDTWPRALAVAVVGLVVLFVVPWVARAFTFVDARLVRGLLGPTRIAERVEDLEVTRARAVDDSAATLRRIERDLHDGTQARLVALAMHLDMAKEELAGADGDATDVERARELLDRAHRTATDAITELREVTRSIHPPALDRGLDEALATLAARSAVPAQVDARLPVRPSPAIETIAYYCVAELLANVARHSGARRASVEVAGDGGLLHVRVTDDGTGGARLVPGHGLTGLAERVATVDGRLTVSSPAGGPTTVAVELPLGV